MHAQSYLYMSQKTNHFAQKGLKKSSIYVVFFQVFFITVPYGKNIKSALIVMFLIITTNLVDVCSM